MLICKVNYYSYFQGVPGLAEWNPNINYASVVAAPTEHFDIVTVSLYFIIIFFLNIANMRYRNGTGKSIIDIQSIP